VEIIGRLHRKLKGKKMETGPMWPKIMALLLQPPLKESCKMRTSLKYNQMRSSAFTSVVTSGTTVSEVNEGTNK